MDELGRLAVSEARETAKYPVVLVLDDVRSMHTVGSAFRTADAFGVAAIYLCGYTPTPPHRDIHKTALGATETVSWKHFPQTEEAIRKLQEDGFRVFAIEQAHQSISLQEFSHGSEPLALVFGNEVSGVQNSVLELVVGVIEIPQWGAKHSLNISVAVGVVLWELVRKRI